MKLITRDTDYAVRALCYMAKRRDEVVSVTQLVKSLKIPQPFLRKILQTLNQAGILESQKGVGGGFKLARPSGDIYLFDLIRVFQGDFELNECMFKKKLCPNRTTCSLRERLEVIEKYAVSQLEPVTIAELVKER
ncbi:MAG: hypothetical protein A3G33_05085 [Omnitrophica bacterium RIFCSPLOWO2_12_FULL_44_17]|uniref:Rrf2 family transcriptional regulator n=1 Tax=Candidatus Danuiimicrobium aquiferis TaxID=1801832 RepID=A0A1G1KX62_9BACT|nr:MAG: hypothetical protein A3B72_01455 [Omnitrophica bacterium RIFCSPHIGHO2_02_FULL_45_28]OGW89151.1 MAG: hypothetical protein A3E74_06250 [Omnitrophica bacterium RIFCSPHIGHO2_12_FULL_44_12]OGW97530.1 MAG: hypothetical protein A3G33_05085 [Omnitrophica bacterium RIFCSPLOWO2_12_FULL_44_17]OGX02083.1 MAG: hypothetical protein A3J12_06380 [Omnitrophica bacterium RIFCSPLOWO2_02_FULL_44_11]